MFRVAGKYPAEFGYVAVSFSSFSGWFRPRWLNLRRWIMSMPKGQDQLVTTWLCED